MSGCNLFVAPLEPSVTDEELMSAFIEFGAIESAKVMKDIHRGNPRGFGFVLFADPNSATSALKNHSSRWKVQYASHDAYNVIKKSRKVYSRNIPPDVNEKELRSFFEQYGSVTSMVLKEDSSKTPQPLNRLAPIESTTLSPCRVCFVEFASESDAAVCVKATEGFKLPNAVGPLLTKFAETPNVRDQRRQRQQKLPQTQIVPPGHPALPAFAPCLQMAPLPLQPPSLPTQAGSLTQQPFVQNQVAVLVPPAVTPHPAVTTLCPPQHQTLSQFPSDLSTSTNSNSSNDSYAQPTVLYTLALPTAPLPQQQPFILSSPATYNAPTFPVSQPPIASLQLDFKQ